jgi:tRNA dimethylallyltransferase
VSHLCWALVGPTAVGKTQVAMEMARVHPIEIVGLDSRQIYKFMDIGTAKPSPRQQTAVPHHMVDIIEPDQRFDAMEYARCARGVITGIAGRGVQPLVVGGTGFYLEALMGNLSEDLPKSSASVRKSLQAELHEKGSMAMWQELQDLDEPTAQRLHPRDRSRVLRTLEIIRTTGSPLSKLTAASSPRPWGTWRVVVLTMDREALKARIRERVELMLESGWAPEVERLLATGYNDDSPGLSSLGYQEMIRVVRGELPVEEAKQRISTRTWRYAKRQMTWFRRFPKERWITMRDDAKAAAATAIELLAGSDVSHVG